jgi:RHH-type rel operon transcriptional repressor/antitoxin RelB
MYSCGVIAIRLNTDIENRLKALAKKTGLTKTFYVREAILNHLEALEDMYAVTQHALCPGKTYIAEEAKHALGISV